MLAPRLPGELISSRADGVAQVEPNGNRRLGGRKGGALPIVQLNQYQTGKVLDASHFSERTQCKFKVRTKIRPRRSGWHGSRSPTRTGMQYISLATGGGREGAVRETQDEIIEGIQNADKDEEKAASA